MGNQNDVAMGSESPGFDGLSTHISIIISIISSIISSIGIIIILIIIIIIIMIIISIIYLESPGFDRLSNPRLGVYMYV